MTKKMGESKKKKKSYKGRYEKGVRLAEGITAQVKYALPTFSSSLYPMFFGNRKKKR